jgi:hypothetical protein
MGMGQREAITAFLHSLFPDGEIEVVSDLSGIERMISFRPNSQDRVAK